MPLAVVMFSLPYQFLEMEYSITERIWFVIVGCRHFFSWILLSFFSFLTDSMTVFMCMCDSTTPNCSHAKKERHVFIKKKKKSREWENDKSLTLCYWNILTALGSLTFYYRR